MEGPTPPDAERALESVHESMRKRLLSGMESLKLDPLRSRPGADIKRLHGIPGLYRLRVGEQRVFYVVYPDERIVYVTDIRHRGRAYD